jgi:hypothetical protein
MATIFSDFSIEGALSTKGNRSREKHCIRLIVLQDTFRAIHSNLGTYVS